MAFSLPKALAKQLRSANYDFLIPVTLNETNLERMLVQILERVVKHGNTSPPHVKQNDSAERYFDLLDALQGNEKLSGFDGGYGRAVLDGWLRTSVVEMIPVGKGKGKAGEQIDFLRLLTVASYRSGLPKWRSRNRKADLAIYGAMLKSVQKNLGENAESLRLRLQKTRLASGIEFNDISYPWKDPEYSGKEVVDISALLEMRFVEGVTAREPRDESVSSLDAPIEAQFDRLGAEMVALLENFKDLSSGELASNLTSVMAIRLFQIPILTSSLLGARLAGDSGSSLTGPEMFFDFTGVRDSASDKLSRRSVQNDLQLVSRLYPRLVLLRETEATLKGLTKEYEEYRGLSSPEKLSKLIELTKNERIEEHTGWRLGQIETAISADTDSPDGLLEEFQQIRGMAESNLEALVTLLVADHGAVALAGYRKWLYSTGGLTSSSDRREYALLEGSMSKTSTWKYSMNDSVLTTLINLCFLDDHGRLPKNRDLEMGTLLKRLRERFGVLVSTPPSYANDSDAHVASVENYEAFTRTLKLLGYFRGLSDDFSAQYVTRPELVQ